MESVFDDFKEGQRLGSGPYLAAALTPVASARCPSRLQSFYYFSNAAHISQDLRHSLFHIGGVKIPKQEQTWWTDVFTAYWKAVGEIVRIEERSSRASWAKVFDAWKEVANILNRAYSSSIFQAWTIPCLYVVGKYLRVFAIKADAELSSQDDVGFDRFQEDVTAEFEKSAKLEEAARVINRMFTLCLSDRCVVYDGCRLDNRSLGLGRRLKTRGNGEYIIQSISYSKHISRYKRLPFGPVI